MRVRAIQFKRHTAIIMILAMICGVFAAVPSFAAVYDSGDAPAAPVVTVTPPSVVTTEVKTDDDQQIDTSIKETGTAIVSIESSPDALAQISSGVTQALIENEIPIVVVNTGVQIELPAVALKEEALTEELKKADVVLEVGAKVVSEAEKEALIAAAPIGGTTGLVTVGSVVVDLTAQMRNSTTGTVTAITGFSDPVPVKIDLSGQNLTDAQIAELTGARIEKDINGNTTVVKLGGTYNPVTKVFTFYTDRFSFYTVLQAADLLKITLAIDSSATYVNGALKTIDVPAMIIDSRTMVPLRYIGESLGAEIQWVEKTRTINIKKDGKTITLVVGKTGPGLDVPATIVNSRTLVPVRYITEAFGANVTWFPSTRKVEIVR